MTCVGNCGKVAEWCDEPKGLDDLCLGCPLNEIDEDDCDEDEGDD
jgi:hypothetical protein